MVGAAAEAVVQRKWRKRRKCYLFGLWQWWQWLWQWWQWWRRQWYRPWRWRRRWLGYLVSLARALAATVPMAKSSSPIRHSQLSVWAASRMPRLSRAAQALSAQHDQLSTHRGQQPELHSICRCPKRQCNARVHRFRHRCSKCKPTRYRLGHFHQSWRQHDLLTASDPNSSNLSQTTNATLTVLDHSNASLSSSRNSNNADDQLRQRAARGDHPQPELHDLQPCGEHVRSLHGEPEADHRLHDNGRYGNDHESCTLQWIAAASGNTFTASLNTSQLHHDGNHDRHHVRFPTGRRQHACRVREQQ